MTDTDKLEKAAYVRQSSEWSIFVEACANDQEWANAIWGTWEEHGFLPERVRVHCEELIDSHTVFVGAPHKVPGDE